MKFCWRGNGLHTHTQKKKKTGHGINPTSIIFLLVMVLRILALLHLTRSASVKQYCYPFFFRNPDGHENVSGLSLCDQKHYTPSWISLCYIRVIEHKEPTWKIKEKKKKKREKENATGKEDDGGGIFK